MTTIIHIKDSKGIPDEVYIGRPGKGITTADFGNPVKIGTRCSFCDTIHSTAGDTLPCYELYLNDRIKNDAGFRKQVGLLHGKTLVCFCKSKDRPDAPCHGDVLARTAASLNKVIIRKAPQPPE